MICLHDAFSEHEQVLVIYTDFSKVSHGLLNNKVKFIGTGTGQSEKLFFNLKCFLGYFHHLAPVLFLYIDICLLPVFRFAFVT